MEESSTLSSDSTSALERKHASMLERLSNRHQSRLAGNSNPNSITPPSFESTQSFLFQFSNTKLTIDSHLSRVRQSPDPSLKPDLEMISIEISALDKLVAENSYFLPPYEIRTCLDTIAHLKQSLDEVTSLVVPKRKFSFKNKPSNKAVQNAVVATETDKKQNRDLEKLRFTDVGVPPGFKANRNKVLVKKFSASESEGRNGEFTLSDLRDCVVGLKGSLRALFIDKLVNCKVYVGAVMGSVLIEGVEGCVFVMASHQIRIHTAKNCDFYLRVRSRPIIEDSSGVRFAPYCLNYEGIETDLEGANLVEKTANWMNVDDFRWLRAVQSPNWSILPENERVGIVDISNFGENIE